MSPQYRQIMAILSRPQENSIGALITGAALVVGLGLVVGLSGFQYYRTSRRDMLASTGAHLLEAAESNAQFLGVIVREHLYDAALLPRNALLRRTVSEFLRSGRNRAGMLEWLELVSETEGYDHALLVSADGVVRASTAETPGDALPETFHPAWDDVLRQRKPVVTKPHRRNAADSLHQAVLVPVWDSPSGGPLLAMLVFRLDLASQAARVLESASRLNSEAALLYAGPETVEYATAPHGQPPSTRPRIPISANAIEALAAAGKQGVVEGSDYRGTPVLAAFAKVGAEGWMLVVKQDASTILAPVRNDTRAFVLRLSLTAAGFILLLGVIWHRQRSRYFRELYKQEAERRRLLKASEEHYRNLAESIPGGIWMSDPEGNMTYGNPHLTQLSGLMGEEGAGTGWPRIVHPDDREAIGATVRAAIGKREPFEAIFRARTPSGTELELMTRGAPRFGGDGRLEGYVGIVADVTERARAVARLQQLSRAVEQSPACVMITDLAGAIQYVNPRFTHMTGYTAAEALGQNPRILSSSDTPDEVYRQLWETILAGGEWRGEIRNRKKNGSVYWVSSSISGIRNPEGEITNFVAVQEDITGWKRAQQELQQSHREIERMNGELWKLSGELLRSEDAERRRIARELHDGTAQLLTGILLNLSRLREGSPRPAEEDRLLVETVSLARQCSCEMRAISYALHPPLLDELGLVAAIRTFIQGFQDRTGIEVEVRIPADFGRLEDPVEIAIFRIIQESLTNVHRHSGSRWAAVSLRRDGSEIRVEIRDRGTGLPMYREGNGTAPRAGVGLLGMRERVRLFSGAMEIASGGSGTTVAITLPARESGPGASACQPDLPIGETA